MCNACGICNIKIFTWVTQIWITKSVGHNLLCTAQNRMRKKHVLCLWCLWYLLLGLFIFRTVRCVDSSKLWAQGPNLGSILKLIHHAGCLELSLIYCSSDILGFSWLYMRTTVTCHAKLCNIQGLDNVCTHMNWFLPAESVLNTSKTCVSISHFRQGKCEMNDCLLHTLKWYWVNSCVRILPLCCNVFSNDVALLWINPAHHLNVNPQNPVQWVLSEKFDSPSSSMIWTASLLSERNTC